MLVPHDLAVGTDWASEIQKQLARVDLVIGVLASDQQSPWVLFELGQASALGRRIVLITSPKSDPLPFALHQVLVLRIDLDNAEAIGFALDQVLSAPEPPAPGSSARSRTLPALGQTADDLVNRLNSSLTTGDARSLERLVADALRASGADVVAPAPIHDRGPDFAVWSDVLEPFVGNPLLVEVKARLNTRADVNQAVHQLASYLGASSSRWGLLLYGDGPHPDAEAWADTPPNVLVLPLRSLLGSLRTQAFPELVRDLRNRRVHGSSS